MAKAKKETKEEAEEPRVHRMVPSPWVAKLRQWWTQASETEVQVRVGTRGSWTVLPNSLMAVVQVEVDRDAQDVTSGGLALVHGQTQYDNAYRWRDEQGKRCDAKLLIYKREGNGVVLLDEITAGGRLSDDASEDIPDEHGGFSPVAIWNAAKDERAALVGHVESLASKVVDLAEGYKGLLEECKQILSGRDDVETAQAFATATAYRAERGFDSLDRIFEKYEPIIRDYAATRKAETLLRTPRPKTGDPIVDTWNMCITACDLPSARLIEQRFGEAGKKLVAAWSEEGHSRVSIVDLWQELRTSLTDGWKDALAALPGALRESLVALTVAVQEHEKTSKEKGESEVKAP